MPSKSKATGYFVGQVETQWRHNGRDMKLLCDFRFVDGRGVEWTAHKDDVVNGASIPRFFWRVIGSPFVGRYRRATVLHDVACQLQVEPFADVHWMLWEAMRTDKTPRVCAWLIWLAVRTCGPRWSEEEAP